MGIEQTLVVFTRKLGVDGQPHRLAVLTTTAGETNGEIDPLVAARFGFHLLAVLLDGEHLFEQGFELHLTKHAARFDIGQHTLQITHALC